MILNGEKAWKCDICGKVFHGGYSNDPYPILSDIDAECCDECNINIVIPARIKAFKESEEAKHEFELRG